MSHTQFYILFLILVLLTQCYFHFFYEIALEREKTLMLERSDLLKDSKV